MRASSGYLILAFPALLALGPAAPGAHAQRNTIVDYPEATPVAADSIWLWDSSADALRRAGIGALPVAEAQISDLQHTTDTGPSPDCAGTTTYQDGEGNCDDLSAAYQPLDADLTDLSDGALTGSKVGTGISGTNVTTGTVAEARIAATIARDSEVTAAITGAVPVVVDFTGDTSTARPSTTGFVIWTSDTDGECDPGPSNADDGDLCLEY